MPTKHLFILLAAKGRRPTAYEATKFDSTIFIHHEP